MARFRNNFFGAPSGKIGDVIFRNLRGKTYICSRPVKVKVSNSPASVANRRKFALFARLTEAMNEDFLMNILWKQSDVPGYCNQSKHLSANYKLTLTGEDISSIKLFPVETCFSGTAVSSVLEGNILKIVAELSGNISSISEMLFPDITARGIMKLTDNAVNEPLPLKFLSLTSDRTEFRKNVPMEFLFTISRDNLKLYNDYPLRNFTFALVINNKQGMTNFFSDNVNGQLQI